MLTKTNLSARRCARFAAYLGCLCAWWVCQAALVTAEDASASRPALHRVPWTTSKVVGAPEPPPPYRAVRVYEQLKIPQPLYAAQEPGTSNLFVVELQRGKEPGQVHRVADRPDVSEHQPLLTLERLIYGLTFHPGYRENRYLYLITNGPMSEKNKFNRISRFTVPVDPAQPIDPDSELVILEWESNGHNGGELAFGPDGMLYCATGDGTSDSDPLQTGQGVDDLLAVMIRIDVDHPTADRPYAIPPDNPFLHLPEARGEIWAFGFRNPWRMTFDRRTGQLWVTQNGQDLWEQVYLVKRGENYGWSVQEGSHPFYPNRPVGPGPIIPPTAEHHHTEARSLTGGVVYYGSQQPELQGAYIYGDYSTGRIWGLRHDGERVTWHQELCNTPFSIVGFAETPSGELVVIDQHSGFYRLEPAPPQVDRPPFPQKLSETGLFTNVAQHELAPGVMPYSVNSPLWSDGAHKERAFAVPGWSQIDFTPTRAWQLPEATVLVKTFSLETAPGQRRRVETRIMLLEQKEWAGYSYAWNEDQTDADLVEKTGRDVDYVVAAADSATGQRTQSWHFPSRAECMVCHSRAAQFVLGLRTEQMNRQHDYPDGSFNQLERLSDLGYLRVKLSEHPGTGNQWKALATKLASAVPKSLSTGQSPKRADWPVAWSSLGRQMAEQWQRPPQTLPWIAKPAKEYAAFPDPADESQPLEARVRSYLHVNCSVCHQDAGGGNAQIELQFATALDKRKLIDVEPLHDKFQIDAARLIAPGNPEQSVLLKRMQMRGRGQMPPLASALTDPQGVSLLEAWIRDLPPDAGKPPAADTTTTSE